MYGINVKLPSTDLNNPVDTKTGMTIALLTKKEIMRDM
jgi:hypothetical protein